jgi:hypothetical protein
MYSKLPTNHKHFAPFTVHETKALHPCAKVYRIDEDTTALALAMTGLALMVVTVVSMLVAFKII